MTKGLKSFFFISIFSCTLFSRACLDKDLRKSFTLRHEQKSQNWCYAYTAADLIYFQFQDVFNGKKISPLHIALLNLANDQLPYYSNEGGDVKDGVSLALAPYSQNYSIFNKGICFDSLDKKVTKRNNTEIRTTKELLAELQFLQKAFKNAQKTQSFIAFEGALKKFMDSNDFFSRISLEQWYALFKESNDVNLGIHFIDLFCPSSERFINIFNPISTFKWELGRYIRLKMSTSRYKDVFLEDPNIILDKIKERLEQDQPTALNFYFNFLINDDNKFLGGALHAVSVVGMSKLGDSCQLIIKNSWGSCYDKEGNSKYSKRVSKCENGFLWIDEKWISKSLHSIDFLVPL